MYYIPGVFLLTQSPNTDIFLIRTLNKKKNMQARNENRAQHGQHQQSFNRKRHAEKIRLKNGRVVVKIVRVNEPKGNSEKIGIVCVHVFTDATFSNVVETYYAHSALNRWSQACSENGALSEDLNNTEFRTVQNSIEKANLTDFVHLKKKALLLEKKMSLAS